MAVVGLTTPDEDMASWMGSLDEVGTIRSYLDVAAVVAAAIDLKVDAVHPGWGFLAEDPTFAEALEATGIVWVGPPAFAMRALGDKAAARRVARRLGLPTLPGYDGDDQTDATLAVEAARVGFPILLKPSAGGGGKGMHVVRSADGLPDMLARARREARSSFGDERMVLERYVEAPRHVEIQLLFDTHGNGVQLGERECSLQRRHQKVIEESPSPNVSPQLRERLGDWALMLAREAGYVSAGTAEFLLTQDGEPFFLELNARLQVEHPVTEAVTGRDLVADQLRIAQGEPLGLVQEDVRFAGHAIEARVYAEDPWAGFVPATGRLVATSWPESAGVRVDAGVTVRNFTEEEIGTGFDPMIAKVVAHGDDRASALDRLRQALVDTRVVGVTTNRGYLIWLLEQPAVVSGRMTTQTIESSGAPDQPQPTDMMWASAAAELHRHLAWHRVPSSDAGSEIFAPGFRLNGDPRLRIHLGDEERTVGVQSSAVDPEWVELHLDEPETAADIGGVSFWARLAPPPTVEAAVSHATRAAEGGQTISAPMPGTILAVRVTQGEQVEAHQVLVLLEAMKMENAVTAPTDAIVRRVLVRPGQTVRRGEALIELA